VLIASAASWKFGNIRKIKLIKNSNKLKLRKMRRQDREIYIFIEYGGC
jgi:hypothetical protein